MSRTAYCTGCGYTFDKMHLLISHRRTDRCGGRFLPEPERNIINDMRRIREELLRNMREEETNGEIL